MITDQSKPTLLVADDEREIGEIIEAVAEDLGFQVTCVTEGSEVVTQIDKLSPTVVTLDLRMPGADGVEIIRALGKKKCASAIILMSGMDQRTLSSVKSLGEDNKLIMGSILTKPMSIEAIEESLKPFLINKVKPAQSVVIEQESYQPRYGLKVLYEPEFQLNPINGSFQNQRLNMVVHWLKDDGTLLTDSVIGKWANEMGIEKGLGTMSLIEVLKDLKRWSEEGFNPEVSFTFGKRQLFQLEIPDILSDLTDGFLIPKEQLGVEVRESVFSTRSETVADVITRLRIKGFNVSVVVETEADELLPMLDSIPVDQIVVDLSELSKKPNYQNDMELEFQYSSLVSLANKKGISACAINVDSTEQYNFARKCNFNSVRGIQILGPSAAAAIVPLYSEGKLSEKSVVEN